MRLRQHLKTLPVVGALATRVYGSLKGFRPFPGSVAYWERRYRSGGNSGAGSYSKFAEYKAAVINAFVAEHSIRSVIEFGCGDGNQLRLAVYRKYLGLDVSAAAIALCKSAFSSDRTKSFRTLQEYAGDQAELGLSLDVVYHLIENDVFSRHIELLFRAATRYVIIYSSNTDRNSGHDGEHVFHRRFTDYVATQIPEWRLARHIANKYPYTGNPLTGSFADFYIYEKV